MHLESGTRTAPGFAVFRPAKQGAIPRHAWGEQAGTKIEPKSKPNEANKPRVAAEVVAKAAGMAHPPAAFFSCLKHLALQAFCVAKRETRDDLSVSKMQIIFQFSR